MIINIQCTDKCFNYTVAFLLEFHQMGSYCQTFDLIQVNCMIYVVAGTVLIEYPFDQTLRKLI